MAAPNYGFEKRQRELQKQKKKEEKRLKKEAQKAARKAAEGGAAVEGETPEADPPEGESTGS